MSNLGFASARRPWICVAFARRIQRIWIHSSALFTAARRMLGPQSDVEEIP